MRKDYGKQTWVCPMPVLIIGTFDDNGNPDAMNAAWGGTYDTNQIIICLSAHQTTDNIRKNKAFTVAFATKETVTASDYVGIVSLKNDQDKMKKSGLRYEKAKNVNAPLFLDYPLVLECELVEIINEGEGGGNIIANIVNASVDESVIENGRVNYEKLHLLTFDPISAGYYALGERVANAFKEGNKLK